MTTQNLHSFNPADVRAVAQTKLGIIVGQGKNKASQGMEALAAEYGMRTDFKVRPAAVDVEIARVRRPAPPVGTEPYPETWQIKPVLDGTRYNLTGHAEGQFLAHAGIPRAFADTVLEQGLDDLFRENVRRLVPKLSNGSLVRAVGGTIKGWLSPAYRRMDAMPVFEAFLTEGLRAGLVPHAGQVTDTRAFLSLIRPEVTALHFGEVTDYAVLGVQLRTSDYGNGKLVLDLFILRLLCNNGATGMDLMNKMHLGRRFDFEEGSDVVKLSSRTIDLDTKTVLSAIRDAVGPRQLPKHFDALCSVVEGAGSKAVNLESALASLKRAGLKAAVVEKVKTAWDTEMPIEALPQERNAWRFSNILSMLANGETDGDAASDLRDAAFSVLTK